MPQRGQLTKFIINLKDYITIQVKVQYFFVLRQKTFFIAKTTKYNMRERIRHYILC